VCLESHFLSAIISVTAIARQLRFFPFWSKGQKQRSEFLLGRQRAYTDRKRKREPGIQIRSIMLPLIPLRLRFIRFSVLTERTFILLSNERETLNTPEWETDASNSSERSRKRSRAVGIKWKKSNRAEMPPRRRFSFHPPYLFCVSNGISFEGISPAGRLSTD